jgi:hypothetical protein
VSTPDGSRPFRCACGKQLARVSKARREPPRLVLDWTGVLRVEATADGHLLLTCRRCGGTRRWPSDG